jgi:hypothetical protein
VPDLPLTEAAEMTWIRLFQIQIPHFFREDFFDSIDPTRTSAVKTKIVMFGMFAVEFPLLRDRLEQIGVHPVNVRERHARLQLDVLGSPEVANHQCACSTASTVVIPAIREAVIAISAGMPRGNSRLISEARKIAATGRAMTK